MWCRGLRSHRTGGARWEAEGELRLEVEAGVMDVNVCEVNVNGEDCSDHLRPFGVVESVTVIFVLGLKSALVHSDDSYLFAVLAGNGMGPCEIGLMFFTQM